MNPVDPFDPDDAEWSARFQTMKASDVKTTPPFFEVWGGARRQAASRSQDRLAVPHLLSWGAAAASLVLAFATWHFTTTPSTRSLAELLPPLLQSVDGNNALFPEGIAFAESASLPSDGLLPFHLHLNFQ